VRRRRCRAGRRVASHPGDNATAPRSARSGWGYRGSREGSLRSPARDPRLFPSTAPRSFSRPNSSAPCGARAETKRMTHGLRRGLGFFRAFGALQSPAQCTPCLCALCTPTVLPSAYREHRDTESTEASKPHRVRYAKNEIVTGLLELLYASARYRGNPTSNFCCCAMK